jgi:hypothetical protein
MSVNVINQDLQNDERHECTQNQITVFVRYKARNINFACHERVRCFGFMDRKLNVVTIFVFTCTYMCMYICKYECTYFGRHMVMYYACIFLRVCVYMYVDYI